VSSEDAARAEAAPPAAASSPVEQAEGKVGQRRLLEPVQRLALTVVALCALLLVWYLVADRLTPYTTNGRVKGFVVSIVPEVSGYVAAVGVHKNDMVDAGQTLLQIDTRRFELAEDSARAALDLAGQDVGASTAGVDAAVAHVAEARTRFETVSARAQRVIGIEDTGAVAGAEVDQARAEIEQARAQLEKAEAELERARQQLGQEGGNNPRTRAAVAALEQARLDLSRTTIIAPSRGLISGLQIDEGHYARAGEPLMTFMAIEEACPRRPGDGL
jgi:multidrug resistance efflux pump